MKRTLAALVALATGVAIALPAQAQNPANCELVASGLGPSGEVNVRVETVASGLEVPWALAFLPDGGLLVTERPGRVRLVRDGKLVPEPVATPAVSPGGEGGLLGLALHPDFASNRFFYLYYTTRKGSRAVNRVERWRLSADSRSATAERVIVDDIPSARFHNGGRLRFGPDGLLYVGTGDARNPNSSQQRQSLAGKLLRLTPDGGVPAGNPFPGSPVFVTGIRNTQGFDWLADGTLIVTDHGPSGDLGLTGLDEVSVAGAGGNLGWPTIYGCRERPNLITPRLSWSRAVPPGGAAVYTGKAIDEWRGSLMVATLSSEHLHRVAIEPSGQLRRHEIYLRNRYGRLREAIMGPDGNLYLTTSNCDGRGACPKERDRILRVTR